MTADERLDIEQIEQLKYRYMRGLDLKRWDELGDCLAEDCRWSSSGGSIEHHGRDAIVKWISDAMGPESRMSSHLVAHPEIVLTSDGSATGIWKLESITVLLDQGLTIRGSGIYRDAYTKKSGQWKMQLTGHEMIFEEAHPREALGIRVTANRLDNGGGQERSPAAAGLPPVRS